MNDKNNPKITIEGYDDKGYYVQAANFLPEITVVGSKYRNRSEIPLQITYVQGFPEATNTKRDYNPEAGYLERVYPEFELLTGLRGFNLLPNKSEKLGRFLVNEKINAPEINYLPNKIKLKTNPSSSLEYYDIDYNIQKQANNLINNAKQFYQSQNYRERLNKAYLATKDRRFENNFIPSQMVGTLDGNLSILIDNQMEDLGLTSWNKFLNKPIIKINKKAHGNIGSFIDETLNHEIAHASGKGTIGKFIANDYNKQIINLKSPQDIAKNFNIQDFDTLTKYMNHEVYPTKIEEIRSRAYSILHNIKRFNKSIDDYLESPIAKYDDQLQELLGIMNPEDVKHFLKNFLSMSSITYTGLQTNSNKQGGILGINNIIGV